MLSGIQKITGKHSQDILDDEDQNGKLLHTIQKHSVGSHLLKGLQKSHHNADQNHTGDNNVKQCTGDIHPGTNLYNIKNTLFDLPHAHCPQTFLSAAANCL